MKVIVGTFGLADGDEPKRVSAEVTGTVSDALVGFRQQCMDVLSSHVAAKSGGGASAAVEANEDAFADNEEVEEDNVDAFLKQKGGPASKKQKT
mmetsp:Transcript_9925/g.24471  ORF Transcript_9925/g.24471 Transcript_9925/m.24471 type:complete len:94 (+) Transcript_9925:163-444(+)|eukprot:CAMPEP_0197602028 /NCGR_PEP_ID=MMETSP1326-20131121/36393_1 /TAXON_ID=1155430 /ORGANISM="Genus nov. species nov., Strain RCC2288" /LENGTH=93 /DNA_ID=CAMNT_0043169317 /DNA_START=102 /DNA_END=383 /DNA_ORIENTATION=-